MRRMTAGLVGAMLALVPMSAIAGPDDDRDDQPQTYQNQQPQTYQDQNSNDAETTDQQPRLGIMVVGMTPDLRMYFAAPRDRGVLVAHVEPSSLASRSGLRVGDVLIGVENRSVRAGDDVLHALVENRGERIRLYIVRDHKPMRLDAMQHQATPTYREQNPTYQQQQNPSPTYPQQQNPTYQQQQQNPNPTYQQNQINQNPGPTPGGTI